MWILLKLDEVPVITDRDGNFDIVALMDASSCFIFGFGYIRADEGQLAESEARKLLKTAYGYKKTYPKK